MAESIRIDATKTVIDTTLPLHVEFYNAAVQDWISRCDSVQYTHEALEAVTEDVEARRPALRSAGRKRFIAWRADMLKVRSVPTSTLPDVPEAEPSAQPETMQPAPGAVPGPPVGATESSEQFATASDDPNLRYAAMLARRANGRTTYPKEALRRREQGAVEIQATIGSDGALKETVVLRSSGYAALDEAALSAIARGTDLPPVPVELVGREFAVSVPFDFKIQDVAR